MNVLVVIQARRGSTRLPGKVLLPLAGKPALQHVVERCQRTGYRVVVACPVEDAGPILKAIYPFTADIVSFAVPNDDVLGRFNLTALHYTPDLVVRVTADCPLVDPALIQQAVAAVSRGHDYAGNTRVRSFPRGLDVEAFTADLLRQAHRAATTPYDREHVTPWMQRMAERPHDIGIPSYMADIPLNPRWRWCLDTPTDYEWLMRLFTQHGDPTPAEVAAYSQRIPPPLD